MKHALLSIIVAVLGMVWVVHINYQIAAVVTEALQAADQSMNPSLVSFPKVYKMSGLVIGLIGIFFGVKGFFKTKPLSIVGIVLSLLLIVLTFIPIFSYLLAD